MTYNLKAEGKPECMTRDQLISYYQANKNHLHQIITASGTTLYILANFSGYVTAITENECIRQDWAGTITL